VLCACGDFGCGERKFSLWEDENCRRIWKNKSSELIFDMVTSGILKSNSRSKVELLWIVHCGIECELCVLVLNIDRAIPSRTHSKNIEITFLGLDEILGAGDGFE